MEHLLRDDNSNNLKKKSNNLKNIKTYSMVVSLSDVEFLCKLIDNYKDEVHKINPNLTNFVNKLFSIHLKFLTKK